MTTRVSATRAARRFSDLLNRIRYRSEEFVVEGGGAAVCRMMPATAPAHLTLSALARLLREIPSADPDYAADVQRAVRGQGRLPRSPWAH
jgi:hypothetical protein